MKKVICLVVSFIFCKVGEGQNLVPNPGFEQYSTCPNGSSQIDSALFWTRPGFGTAYAGTPDYFNACSAAPPVTVPLNAVGFQQAHNGSAYAGIILYNGNAADVREYLEVPLISSLVANSTYYFQMHINKANTSRYITDAIHVYFSDTLISGVSGVNPLPFTPQIINSSGMLTDTLNWILFSGTYTAHGGESYILLGNFNVDSLTNTVFLNYGNQFASYCLIDDVSLSLLTTGEGEPAQVGAITLYPNPFHDDLSVFYTSNKKYTIVFYDITSRVILRQSLNGSCTLDLSQFNKGLYSYEVMEDTDGSGPVVKKGKIVKE